MATKNCEMLNRACRTGIRSGVCPRAGQLSSLGNMHVTEPSGSRRAAYAGSSCMGSVSPTRISVGGRPVRLGAHGVRLMFGIARQRRKLRHPQSTCSRGTAGPHAVTQCLRRVQHGDSSMPRQRRCVIAGHHARPPHVPPDLPSRYTDHPSTSWCDAVHPHEHVVAGSTGWGKGVRVRYRDTTAAASSATSPR